MNVWFCIPAKRALADSSLPVWREQGYKIAIMRERDDGDDVPYDLVEWVSHYHGWAHSINHLVRVVMARDPDAKWFVSGGDDTLPDLHHTAVQIGEQCSDYFYLREVVKAFREAGCTVPDLRIGQTEVDIPEGLTAMSAASLMSTIPDGIHTFGVMQPTGDRWGEDDTASWAGKPEGSAIIDRICGSPWLGRMFCQLFNGGLGPMWPEYWHMFADEELHDVTEKLGLLWQRRDLTQQHEHWARPRLSRADMPGWAATINGTSEWEKSKALFTARKAAGFPGHEPIPFDLASLTDRLNRIGRMVSQ